MQALGVVAEVALEGRRRKCERGLHLCEKSKIKMYKFHVLKCKINLFYLQSTFPPDSPYPPRGA